jgi:hypothetical protein
MIAAVAVAIGAGLAVRILIMRTSIGVLDSDEAVVGLMARHMGHGSYRAFFWGQNYGGTIETLVTAAVFKLIGTSGAALKAVPMAFDGCAAVLVWRIGRRVTTPTLAVVAALLVWLWPANYLWWSVKARGFYEATLCLSLACALLMLRIAHDRRGNRWRNWAVLGLLAGLGWWQTPQVMYILVPAGLWLTWVRRGAVGRVIAGVPTFAVGAAPWLVANINSGFASLNPPAAVVKGNYGDHLLTFVREGLPMTFGLKYVYLSRWIVAPHLGALVYALGVGVVVAGCLRRHTTSVLLGMVILAYPFLHALLTLSGEVAEGRYTLLLLPWLALALARACRPRLAILGLAVVVVAASVIGLRDLRGQTSPYGPDRRVPTSLAALERSLTDHGVRHVWANYWIAYRITFETHERIVSAPRQPDRYPPYERAVAADPAPAFVFLSTSRDVPRFRAWLVDHPQPVAEWSVGGTWTVFVPSMRVTPDAFPGVSI